MKLLRLPRALACLAPFGCLLLVAGGCGNKNATTSDVKGAEGPPSVVTKKPQEKVLHQVIEQPAYIEAFEETPLFARLSGYVQKVHVDIGDRVKGPRHDEEGSLIEPGQVLAELWVPEMEEELRQKKALVSQAKAEVDQASAIYEVAVTNIDKAKALVTEAEAGRDRADSNVERWRSEHKRIEPLAGTVLDKGVLAETLNQLESAKAARKEVEAKVGSAKAGHKESEAKRDKAKADIAAAEAKVKVAEADQARLKALLDYSKVRAPYDGVITSRTIHTGHYLTGMATKPLFIIASTDVVRVLAEVPEASAMFIYDSAAAKIRCSVLKDVEIDAKVTRSSWSLDAKARTLRTEITLANKGEKFRPGMYATVTFRPALPKTFTVPASATVTLAGETCLYREENGKAVLTSVKLGAREGDLVQVLKKRGASDKAAAWEDFTGTEDVIMTNPGNLSDGQTVVVERR